MGVYAGVTDNYLTQNDQTRVADAVKKYSLWAIGKEGNPGRKPGIDLNFAENKSLVDDVTNTNLVTFTRTSAATYVDSSGVIKTAGVNLLTYSEDFSQWGILNASLNSSISLPLAPDGTSTASLLTLNNGTFGFSIGSNNGVKQGVTKTDGVDYIFSTYVKSNGARYAYLQISVAAVDGGAWYDFDTGNTSLNLHPYYVNEQITATSVGNGWYRISLKFNLGSAVTGSLVTAIASSTSQPSGTYNRTITGDGSSGIYIWGAHLEQSSTLSVYAKTTTTASGAPRFDHDPDTGESLGLLIEESRTNLLPNSVDIGGSGWSFYNTNTVVNNAITAPNGLLEGQKLVEGSGTTYYAVYDLVSGGNNTYTTSIFVKQAESDRHFYFENGAIRAGINLSTGVAFYGPNSYSADWTNPILKIVSYPNGWYKCSLTGTASSNVTSVQSRFHVATLSGGAGGIVYSGDSTSGVYLWGPQLEAGSFPTSYIPTSGSTVTRSVDSALLSTSNWWDYTKGTAYAEYRGGLESTQSGYGRVWSPFTVATFIASNAAQTYNNRHVVWFGGSTVQVLGQEHLSSFAKNAMTYSNNGTNCDIVNASYPASATGTTNSCIDSASHGIGRNVSATTNMLNGHIKRMIYWEQVLDPSTLQSLTE